MGETSLKDRAVIAVVVVIALYAVAVVTWFMYAESAWKRSNAAYDREKQRFEKEEKLISERGTWNASYEKEKAAMPTFEAGKATDTTWLRKVEALARTNLVLVTSIRTGDEVEVGEVLELPIEIDASEGSLEAFVRFMHALENSSEGMFDIREISLKPGKKKGYLTGSLSITCAYMRE